MILLLGVFIFLLFLVLGMLFSIMLIRGILLTLHYVGTAATVLD
jgi:hypothetical protein